MKNAITRNSDKRVARPLKVLVPLIKQDLHDAKEAADQAGIPYYIAAGEKLIEAKSQLNAMSWGDWLSRNFHLSQSTSIRYMRLARTKGARDQFETISEFVEPNRHPGHRPSWTEPVADSLKRLKIESFNLRERDISRAQERKLERELGLNLIDIGYKVLAVKMHPDKTNGSADAMRRLNRVRARLKEAA
jgi:hypothetical protein